MPTISVGVTTEACTTICTLSKSKGRCQRVVAAGRSRRSTVAPTSAPPPPIELGEDVVASTRRSTTLTSTEDRRKARRQGASRAVTGDNAYREVLTKTTAYDDSGVPYVDRGGLGGGKECWYALFVLEGKELKYAEYVTNNLQRVPPLEDPETGESVPRTLEAWVPTKKKMMYSPSVDKLMAKTVRYPGSGGWAFVKCVMDNELHEMISKTPYFISWRRSVSVRHPFEEETVDLPVPCSEDFMVEVNEWLTLEESEDLEERRQEVYGSAGGAVQGVNERKDMDERMMDVDEYGRKIYKNSELGGTYLNPSNWYDGPGAAADAEGSGAKPKKGRKKGAGKKVTEMADLEEVVQAKSKGRKMEEKKKRSKAQPPAAAEGAGTWEVSGQRPDEPEHLDAGGRQVSVPAVDPPREPHSDEPGPSTQWDTALLDEFLGDWDQQKKEEEVRFAWSLPKSQTPSSTGWAAPVGSQGRPAPESSFDVDNMNAGFSGGGGHFISSTRQPRRNNKKEVKSWEDGMQGTWKQPASRKSNRQPVTSTPSWDVNEDDSFDSFSNSYGGKTTKNKGWQDHNTGSWGDGYGGLAGKKGSYEEGGSRGASWQNEQKPGPVKRGNLGPKSQDEWVYFEDEFEPWSQEGGGYYEDQGGKTARVQAGSTRSDRGRKSSWSPSQNNLYDDVIESDDRSIEWDAFGSSFDDGPDGTYGQHKGGNAFSSRPDESKVVEKGWDGKPDWDSPTDDWGDAVVRGKTSRRGARGRSGGDWGGVTEAEDTPSLVRRSLKAALSSSGTHQPPQQTGADLGIDENEDPQPDQRSARRSNYAMEFSDEEVFGPTDEDPVENGPRIVAGKARSRERRAARGSW